MPTSEIWLRPEDVLEAAKNVMRPMQCEWNTSSLQNPEFCRDLLTSWHAYQKHIIFHCQEQHRKTNLFICRLPRCTIQPGAGFASYDKLISHIQQSHLSRSQLQCPASGCTLPSFTRHNLLEVHFVEAHPELLNQQITLPSPHLLPLWLPFYPPPVEVESLNLPTEVLPGSAVIPSVDGTWKARPSTPPKAEGSRTMASLFGSPKKRLVENPAVTEDTVFANREARNIIFDDLPKQLDGDWNYALKEEDCVIRSVTTPRPDVARPQPLLDPNIYGQRIPQITILYQAFLRHLDDFGEDEGGQQHEEK